MNYIVQEKALAIRDKFAIKNDQGDICFQVTGRAVSLGDREKIMDADGNLLFSVDQKVIRVMPVYRISDGSGNIVAKVRKQVSPIRARFEIESDYGNYQIQGRVFDYNYSINKDGQAVATVSKKVIAIRDGYRVSINDSEDQGFLMSLVIVIDQVMSDSGN